MKLLAIETSSIACSVALQVDDRILERHIVQPKVHTTILIPTIRELLAEGELQAQALDAIVLGNGPGSFIGMRIAASVAQGLAHAAGLGIVPVSSLAAVAADVMQRTDAKWVAVAQDARMSEVYLGLYQRLESGVPQPVIDEAIYPAGRIETLQAAGNAWVTAGAAWKQYPALLTENSAALGHADDAELPRARCLFDLAVRQLASEGAIPPDQLQPAYLRHQVATPPGS